MLEDGISFKIVYPSGCGLCFKMAYASGCCMFGAWLCALILQFKPFYDSLIFIVFFISNMDF